MEIALPSSGNMVDGLFGHCEYITVITVDDQNNIVNQEIVQPPVGCGFKSNIVDNLANIGESGRIGEGFSFLNLNPYPILPVWCPRI